MGSDYQAWLGECHGERTVAALKKNGFDAHFVQSVGEARDLILGMLSPYETFGFGGSETTRSLGLIEVLKERGKTVLDHWQDRLSKEEDLRLRLEQGRCDCFFCSANALSATGEIVNADGIGNRTNAMSFGPKKVVIVAGMNKVCQDLDAALRRVREVAGPMRARSLGMNTPCAETGICTDCRSPQRICRITVILHRRPLLTDVSVVLINQPLGF